MAAAGGAKRRGGCLRVKENPYTPFQSLPFERRQKPSSVCTEITTYHNDDGNGPDKRPDEMVINPQPAPTERKKEKKEISVRLIPHNATQKLCHCDRRRRLDDDDGPPPPPPPGIRGSLRRKANLEGELASSHQGLHACSQQLSGS